MGHDQKHPVHYLRSYGILHSDWMASGSILVVAVADIQAEGRGFGGQGEHCVEI